MNEHCKNCERLRLAAEAALLALECVPGTDAARNAFALAKALAQYPTQSEPDLKVRVQDGEVTFDRDALMKMSFEDCLRHLQATNENRAESWTREEIEKAIDFGTYALQSACWPDAQWLDVFWSALEGK